MKYHSLLFPVCCLLLGGFSFWHYNEPSVYQPVVVLAEAAAPTFWLATSTIPHLSAPAFAVFDSENGDILASAELDVVYPIASLTKLFTATAILEHYDPEATTTIIWNDIEGGGASGKLAPTQVYSYRELLFPLLLESSNDAALTLDHATAGELVTTMTSVARAYGAVTTAFSDTSGLSPKNTSTVRDLITFSRAVGEAYPFVYDIAQLPQYIGHYTGWRNNNPVFDTVSYRGGKHGYTPAAGRTLVARFAEPFTGGTRTIGYIILGSSDLRADTAILRDYIADSVDYK